MAVEEAVGALAAHSIRQDGVVLRKGETVSAEVAAALRRAGIARLVAARLEPGEIGEDEAARRLADAVAGEACRIEPPFTGRCNLFATEPGLFVPDRAAIDRINAVDEALTVATLPAYKPVLAGEMIATVKVIPYAVPPDVLAAALAGADRGTVRVAPYRVRRVGVISTTASGLKPATVAKTVAALRDRLAPTRAEIVAEATCPHETEALRAGIAGQVAARVELLVVFGASAIADRRDVIPAAIEEAGGDVEHFGMPVDPGNLLLVGRVGTVPVIGAPGCARSPKENGFDWILGRLLARIDVTRADITALGVGGLLMEIVSRGQPRAGGVPEES